MTAVRVPFQARILRPMTVVRRSACTLRAQRVDASCSKRKLLSLRKSELVEACNAFGIEAKGTKAVLADAIRAHFESETENPDSSTADAAETVVMRQTAAPEARPVAKAVSDANAGPVATLERLQQQVRDLDATVEAKTAELQELQAGSRLELQGVTTELKELQTRWQVELAKVHAGVDDALQLQQYASDVATLRAQQAELQDNVAGLSRLLRQRDDEIGRLGVQLKELREEQCAAAKLEAEKVVQGALSSLAGVPPATLPRALQTRSSLPASPPVDNAPDAGDAGAQSGAPGGPASGGGLESRATQLLPSLEGRTVEPDRGERDARQRVFGMALPGLFAAVCAGRIVDVYVSVRNAFATEVRTRRGVDFGVLGVLAAALALVSG